MPAPAAAALREGSYRSPILATVLEQQASASEPIQGRDWGETNILALKFFIALKSEVLKAAEQKNPDGAKMAVSRAWKHFRD